MTTNDEQRLLTEVVAIRKALEELHDVIVCGLPVERKALEPKERKAVDPEPECQQPPAVKTLSRAIRKLEQCFCSGTEGRRENLEIADELRRIRESHKEQP
jgi:hypothetical protein